jgi:DNA (cytosine-5)-methyltransferase 1
MTDSYSYYNGKFGPHYYRGNRRRSWDKPSFTIHATGYNIPLHPSSPSMIYNAHEDWSFIKGRYREYRRLTVRECARIQTFPDNFEIDCTNIIDAYKMIGNAVPVRMAEILATSIKEAIEKATYIRKQQRGDIKPEDRVLVGFYKGYPHWKIITHQGFYYVRADGREGAMSIKDLQPLPRLLLLHSNDRMQLYEVTDIEPRYYGKDYIQRLGFEPSGETYIGVGFDASSKYKLKEVGIDKDKINIQERFAPYITTYKELISTK